MQTRTLPRSGRACLQGGLGFARIANILCDSNVKPGTTNCIAVVIQYSASLPPSWETKCQYDTSITIPIIAIFLFVG